MTENEMRRMQQEAMRRTQEMARRAEAFARRSDKNSEAEASSVNGTVSKSADNRDVLQNTEKNVYPYENPHPAEDTVGRSESSDTSYRNKPPDTLSAEAAAAGGIFDMLFKDKEKTLILGLLLLLMDEKTDNSLIFALAYLLI